MSRHARSTDPGGRLPKPLHVVGQSRRMVREHHLQPCLLDRFIRAARRAIEPPLYLLNADRVLRAQLADFNVEHRGRETRSSQGSWRKIWTARQTASKPLGIN